MGRNAQWLTRGNGEVLETSGMVHWDLSVLVGCLRLR